MVVHAKKFLFFFPLDLNVFLYLIFQVNKNMNYVFVYSILYFDLLCLGVSKWSIGHFCKFLIPWSAIKCERSSILEEIDSKIRHALWPDLFITNFGLIFFLLCLQVREYIDDTEDYVNIQLDNQRNELIQLQLTLTIASFAIVFETSIAGLFGMNIPCTLYNINGIFEIFVGGITAGSILIFLLVLGYARWKKLLGS